MKGYKHSPERAFRPQAGVKPLQRMAIYNSPERATECAVTPSGLGVQRRVNRGFTPACSLARPLAFKVGKFNSNTFFHQLMLNFLPCKKQG
jgi:hypothetical protein